MKLAISMALLMLGQILVWLQLNSQFFSEWSRRNTLFLAVVVGGIVSYIFMLSTRYAVEYFDGELWPGRLISFSSGMIVMSLLTWYFMGQGINAKTAVSILLSFIILCIQIFWK